MAKLNAKHKVPDVHLKYALYLEDEQRYKEAEDHFVKAGKPSEAINMYEVQADFHSALQIARQYEPQSVPQIFINQAKFLMERRDFPKAEIAFISAKKPELAIKMFMD
jgi:intraflagellar transport protein 172